MKISLKGKSFASGFDFSTEQIWYLINLALTLKKTKYIDKVLTKDKLLGKNIVLLFQKDSTRTASAFQIACADLGASCTYIGATGSNFGKKESVEDTAIVLGRFYDAIAFRCFKHSDLLKFVKNANVPVYNALSDFDHPTQVLTDLLTLHEHYGELKNKKAVFIGDIKNNIAASLVMVCAFSGMNIVLSGPQRYFKLVHEDVVRKAQNLFAINGGSLTFIEDKFKAAKDADVVYTDGWLEIGEDPKFLIDRIDLLRNYQVDTKTMKAAKKSAIFMHCLPAFHDDRTEISAFVKKTYGKKYPEVSTGAMEVTDEVFKSKQSVVFTQTENRVHVIKALLLATLG
ncbi:ornithine carbamoyltransferase [[Mycoplasma] testudinis]|uniref:ornithine carbamoyltransferase n=1 Tax=[Mycoplasma] testudinis TaxID=33924 RepID=UPI000480F8CF|nr:ornithine carbamoyltransferase [[Mycoplasma] testudinis]